MTTARSECEEWAGPRNDYGYGFIQVKSRLGGRTKLLAHRLAWMRENGPIPEGLNICHRCDNPSCVSQAHLFVGTQRENLEDMANKGRAFIPPPQSFKGEENGSCKITKEIVGAIRNDKRTQRVIALEHNISQANVSFIKSGKRWS